MTIYLNCDDNNITYNRKNYLLRAAKRLGLYGHTDGMKFDDHRNAHGQADYILNIEPCTVKAGKKWSGLWHIDVLLDGQLAAHYGEMNTNFISSPQSKYEQDKTQVLFQATDPKLHRRIETIEQEYDFVICGSMGGSTYDMRAQAYDIMKEQFSFHDFQKEHKPLEYVQIINKARVQFIRTGTDGNGNGAIAQRFFECLGIGPVLTNYTPDLEQTGLVEGVDYFAYHNDEEMVDKMRLLLENKELRDAMAKSGRQKALSYHTYEHRLMSIVNAANDYTNSPT